MWLVFRISSDDARSAYGFSRSPIELQMGGLVLGERVRPIIYDREYLVRGLAEVERVAGVRAGAPFFEGLLAEGSYVSDSEPPCRAVVVMQELAPERAFAFAHALPAAYYEEGRPLDDPALIGEIAATHGVDAERFVAHWQSDEARAATQRAFMAARAAGIVSYPTLRYRRAERTITLVKGFMAPEEAVQVVRGLRANGRLCRQAFKKAVAAGQW
ncbi:hypothetical protein HC891_07225 [Candidatus Gracilibacteria bacterium]|nr:hypothetical protein [Candidatus Gracilibacteria bacterium]